MNIKSELEALQPSMVAMRRDFHANPELGFQEFRTSKILGDHLEKLGFEVERGVGITGVIGRLKGGKPGKTVMIRADIDALPILETTGASYASSTPGVMHACGHDGHATIAAHVATVFAQNRSELSGTFKFVFQPAEEVVGGATAMLEHKTDLMDDVDAVVGLHLWNDQPVGWVGVRAGAVMAAPDSFTITIKGKGGHAASPHQAIDPVVVAAHLITALQTLVSRETNPTNTAVVTIASLKAGEGASNIIPETAELRGTLRTFDPELRSRLTNRIKEMTVALSSAFGATGSIDWVDGPPPVVNDTGLTTRFEQVAREVNGSVVTADQTMGGEDVAEFLARKPGVFFFVGSNDTKAPEGSMGRNKAHHHPGFDFDDERALPLAAELLAKTALEFSRS
jgi:amidohydrolase